MKKILIWLLLFNIIVFSEEIDLLKQMDDSKYEENAVPKVITYADFKTQYKGFLINKKVNKALEEMKADGTLASLSKKWFNEDFTK